MKKKLRILAIGAHPDDNEIRMGGTALKYIKEGHIVKFVSTTNGETGHHQYSGLKTARIRKRETEKACQLAGIESQVMDIASNRIETDFKTRKKIINLIRLFKPDIIFTHRLNDYHPDHRKTAELVIDSSYAIRVPGVCPLTTPLRYSPLIVFTEDNFKKPVEFEADIVVLIDDVLDKKIKMLDCHKSQMYEWLPWVGGFLDQVPEKAEEKLIWLKEQRGSYNKKTAVRFRDKLKARYGTEKGKQIEFAEAFEISEYGRQLDEDIKDYFPL